MHRALAFCAAWLRWRAAVAFCSTHARDEGLLRLHLVIRSRAQLESTFRHLAAHAVAERGRVWMYRWAAHRLAASWRSWVAFLFQRGRALVAARSVLTQWRSHIISRGLRSWVMRHGEIVAVGKKARAVVWIWRSRLMGRAWRALIEESERVGIANLAIARVCC